MAAPVNEDKHKWGYQETCDFITLYEQHECLYNNKIKEYNDKQKRWFAIQEIAQEFNVTESDVTEKINCVRSQYTRERRKLAEVPGHNPTWVHFEAVQFLHDYTTPRKNRPNLSHRAQSQTDQSQEVGEENGFDDTDVIQVIVEESAASSDTEDVVLGSKRQLPPPSRMSKKRWQNGLRTLGEEQNGMLRDTVSITDDAATRSTPSQLEMDADDLFGQYISSELKTIRDHYTKKLIKHQIQTLLFEGQLSTQAHKSPTGVATFRTPSLQTVSPDQGHVHGEARPFTRKFASPTTGTLGASDRKQSDAIAVSHHSVL